MLQHVYAGVGPGAVSIAPSGRQLHPDDLETLLLVLQSLTTTAASMSTPEV